MQKYYIDNELKVVEHPEGYRQVDLSRKLVAPSDALKGQVDAIKEFKEDIESLLTEFNKEMDDQETEIDAQIKHLEFFLHDKFKHHQWGFNQMFDRLRLQYTSQLDSLKKEKRGNHKEKILRKINFNEKLMDAKKELSPFRNLF